MKLPFFKSNKKNDVSAEANPEAEDTDTEQVEEMDTGTKVKIVAALLVVAFATYVAYWVQEPSDVRVDVLGVTEETMSLNASADDSMVMIAASETTQATSMTTAAQEVEVSIIDFAFVPANLTADAGTTVVWTNKDTVPHTVTGPDFSSGTLNPGESYSHVFAADGTFDYTCSFHPQMKGQVIVGAVAEAVPVATEETLTATEEALSTDLLTLQPAAPEVTPETDLPSLDETTLVAPVVAPDTLAFDTQALMASQLAAQAAEDQVHAAAAEQASLAKSGPEDMLYFALLGVILYFNRKKILGALR